MKVYAEVNRISLGAYDQLAEGGVAEHTHLADPFLTAFTSDADREVLVDEFRHVEAIGGEVEYDRLDTDEIHSSNRVSGRACTAVSACGTSASSIRRGLCILSPTPSARGVATSSPDSTSRRSRTVARPTFGSPLPAEIRCRPMRS